MTKAFERGDLGKDQYMAFQREVEETRGALNRYKADLSGLQSEQERLASNTERLNKLFAATGSGVDDYADVLGSRLVTAIRNGTASSDQLKTAVERLRRSRMDQSCSPFIRRMTLRHTGMCCILQLRC